MEQTVAFLNLMDLIRFVGSFVTTPLFFGLSVINLLVITFVFNLVIGILLGGTAPRIVYEKSDNVLHPKTKSSDKKGGN